MHKYSPLQCGAAASGRGKSSQRVAGLPQWPEQPGQRPVFSRHGQPHEASRFAMQHTRLRRMALTAEMLRSAEPGWSGASAGRVTLTFALPRDFTCATSQSSLND